MRGHDELFYHLPQRPGISFAQLRSVRSTMKTLVGAVLAISIFVTVALAVDTSFKTRLITSSTLTIHVKDGQFITIRNFTQDQAVGQRGVIVAGVVSPTPSPTPTATATATPTLSTNAGPGIALSTGDKLNDTAILVGDNNPNGTITFTLFDPTNLPVYIDVVTVSGNATYTTSTGNNPGGFSPTTTGTYTWTALYSNDTNGNPAVMDNHQNETVNVTATPTPTPTPTPSPTPTLIFGTVLTASIANVSTASSADFIKPIVIAGQATLTIDPVPGATLSITYRKSLQPIQPTPTATVTSTTTTSSTSSVTATSTVGVSSTSSLSVVATALGSSDEDDTDSPTPIPTPTVAPTPSPTPTAIPTPTPLPIPTP